MSTGTVSPQFDQFSDSSTIVGVDKTREEYLKLFSRASYSPLCDRPYSSPISGIYNAVNTSTKLVLLNYRVKNCRLREQILLEELSSSSKNDFEYEKNDGHRICKSIPTDILKGQTKFWHNRRCTSSCLADNLIDMSPAESSQPRRSHTPQVNIKRSTSVNHRRSQSVLGKRDNYYNEPQSYLESFCQYQRISDDRSIPEQFDLQQDPIKETIDQRMKTNNNRRKLPLTKGQQLYLIGKHHIYDITDTKLRRSNSYAQTLNSRCQADNHCKPQFRLSDTRDYSKYSKYLNPPRSLSPISTKSKPLIPMDSQKPFTIDANKPATPKRILNFFIPT